MAETLNDAIALIRSGNRDSARPILKEIIRVEPHNVSAWLWLVETLPHDADKIKALEYCAQLNPQDQTAPKALEMLKARMAPEMPLAATPAAPASIPVEPAPAPEPPAMQAEPAAPVEPPPSEPAGSAVPGEPPPPAPVEVPFTPFQQAEAPVVPVQEPPAQPAPMTPFQQASEAVSMPAPAAVPVNEAPVATPAAQESPAPAPVIPMPPPAAPVAQTPEIVAAAASSEALVKASTPPFPTGTEPPFIAVEPPKTGAEKSTLPEPVIETQDIPEPRPKRRRSLRWLIPAILVSFLIFLLAGLGFLYIQYVINR